jgi:catechol 2,3-dioxygenase-like lactoylglutathione lyase family enzyme
VLGDYPISANIPVTDIARSKDFYENALGLRVVSEEAGHSVFFEAGNGTVLEINLTQGSVGAGHTEAGFTVPDLERVVAGLKERGVEFQDVDMGEGMATVDGILTMGPMKAAWLVDPDNNVVGLFQPPPSE